MAVVGWSVLSGQGSKVNRAETETEREGGEQTSHQAPL